MADKLRAQQQLEALQARYIGIGSADTTKHEWTSNIARDSLSSYVGHPPLLQYMSIGLGQPREKTRLQLLERMVRPVGPPPEVSDDREEGLSRKEQANICAATRVIRAYSASTWTQSTKQTTLCAESLQPPVASHVVLEIPAAGCDTCDGREVERCMIAR